MVLTRSQAAKSKAVQSPEPSPPKLTKQQRKKQPEGGDGTAASAAADVQSSTAATGQEGHKPRPGMGIKASKLGRLRTGPTSHPLTSLPNSPAGPAPVGEFSIPAVQQQQAAPEQQRLEAEPVLPQAPAQPAAANIAQGQQPDASQAISVERQQPAVGEAAVESRPACASLQQAAQPAALQPRAEKLLKPLPDKPVACDKLPDGPEPVQVDVEYVATQDLQGVEDVAAAVAAVVPGLSAADWVDAIKALNLLRQLTVHHPAACASQLEELVPLVLKSVRSLRSSVCKTAVMAVADLYTAYGDALLPYTDVGGQLKPATSLLAQLLLKCASNDKKFVVEEAQRALQVLVESLTPAEGLRLLLPYADQHKNPKVRGKAGGAVADAAARMQPAQLLAFGHPRLLKAAGKLVTDNTPDARDSAKKLIGLLQSAFANPAVEAQLAVEVPAPAAAPEGEEAPKQPTKWEAYCQATLGTSAALAVIKASSE